MEVIILAVLFIILILIGFPIALSMLLSSFVYAILTGDSIGFLGMRMFSSLNFILLAIPFFLLAAEIMNETKISDKIFDFANSIIGFLPGGLGHVNVLTSIIFSGMSGSAVADVGGIGRLSFEAMEREGFDKYYSAGVTLSSSIIGPIIPPSIPMIIFGMVANISVARLFLGGIIPGLMMGFSLMGYIFIKSILDKNCTEVSKTTFNLKKVATSFTKGFFPLLTPVILLGGIFIGAVTITEASVLAVIYSIIIGILIYKSLTIKKFKLTLENVFIKTGPILIMLMAAQVFSFILISENIPQSLASFLTEMANSKMTILIVINLLFLLVGLFSDPTVNIILLVPMILPVAQAFNLNLTHLGVIIVLNSMIGLITPPVGQLLFTMCGVRDDIELEKLVISIVPFFFILIANLVLVNVFPGLVTFLPNLFF